MDDIFSSIPNESMVQVLRKILIIITILQLANATVKWELVTKPIVFSNDVTLKCYNSQENICRSGGRKWNAGPNYALLVFDEGPVNKTKYGSECVEDGFTLTIKHFDLEDFNQYYACSYGFEQYGANLSTDNYEFHPMTNTFNISNIVSGTIDSIDVNFLKVYPFPQCFLLDKDVLMKPQKVFQNFTSYFYRGNITFEYKLMEEGCGQNLSIVCHDASNNSIQLPYNTLLKQCLGSKKEKSIEVVVLCISVSLVLVEGFFLFFFYKKIRRNPKKDKQRGKSQSVESGSSCWPICRVGQDPNTSSSDPEKVRRSPEKERADKKNERKPTEVVRPQPSRPLPPLTQHIKTDNTGREDYSTENEMFKPHPLPNISGHSDSPRPLPKRTPDGQLEKGGIQLEPLADFTSERKKKKKRKKKETKRSDEDD